MLSQLLNMESHTYQLNKSQTQKKSKIQLNTNQMVQLILSKLESILTFQYPLFQKCMLQFSETKKSLLQKQTLKNMQLKLMDRHTNQSLMELKDK